VLILAVEKTSLAGWAGFNEKLSPDEKLTSPSMGKLWDFLVSQLIQNINGVDPLI